MKIDLKRFHQIIEKAYALDPSKGILPALAGFSSYNPDTRKRSRDLLFFLQEKVSQAHARPEPGQDPDKYLKEAAVFSALIYSEICTNRELTENDAGLLFNVLMGAGEKGRAYAWRIWQGHYAASPYLRGQVTFFPDEIKLAFTDHYINSSLDRRRRYARFFRNLLKDIRSRKAVLGHFTGLFKTSRIFDPFWYNLPNELISPDRIIATDLVAPDPGQRAQALAALSLITPPLEETLLARILKNDPDTGVRTMALTVVEKAPPASYPGLTRTLLPILYKARHKEALAAFRALALSALFPPHRLMDTVKANRPDLLKPILAEIESFSRLTFIFTQDMAAAPDRYFSNSPPLFSAMVRGLASRHPAALAQLLKEQSPGRFAGQLAAWHRHRDKQMTAFAGNALDRIRDMENQSKNAALKLSTLIRAAKGKQAAQGGPAPAVSLKKALFDQTRFSELIDPELTYRFDRCGFRDCDFSYTRFKEGSFKQSVFLNTAFTAARFESTRFDRAVFHGISISGSRFLHCTFRDAGFQGCTFSNSDLKDTVLTGATLSESRFDSADLSGVSLVSARIINCRFEHCPTDQTDVSDVRIANTPGLFLTSLANRQAPADERCPMDIPEFSISVKSDIRLLVHTMFTHYGAAMFMARNRLAKLSACDLFTPKAFELFTLIPLMIHENLSFPGYNTYHHLSPCGIREFSPSAWARSVYRKYMGKKTPKNRAPATCAIEGLFSIGSTGTIAQNSASDIDYWVCINEARFDLAMRNSLEEKLEKLEIWAQDAFKKEIHFFVVDLARVKNNDFGDADIHGSGSAQAAFLKDEFYRTMIHIAGGLPLWAVLPPAVCQTHYEAVQSILSRRPDTCPLIDLGNVQEISRQEYYGALIWQIFKGIQQSFKSIIKMTLVEMYFCAPKGTPLLCNQFKAKWINAASQTPRLDNDPYYALLKSLVESRTQSPEDRSAELIRLCFVLQLSNLNPTETEKSCFRTKPHMINRMITQAQWGNANLFKLGDVKKWHFSNIIKISDILKRHFLERYRALGSTLDTDGTDAALISETDRTILARRMFVQFSTQPGKVENLALVVKSRPYFQALFLNHNKDKGKWFLVHCSGRLGDKRQEILKTAGSIEEIAAWMINNRLYTDTIPVQMTPNSTYVTSDDVNRLFSAMNALFSSYDREQIKLSTFLNPPRILYLFISANFYESRTCKHINGGVAVHMNSWGEMFCSAFSSSGGFDSADAMEAHLARQLNLSHLPADRTRFFPKRFRYLAQA